MCGFYFHETFLILNILMLKAVVLLIIFVKLVYVFKHSFKRTAFI